MTTTYEKEGTLQETIETAELGHTFTEKELADQCRAIIGGVAWPGRRAGFGVVLGLDRREFFGGSHMFLLDEVESHDLDELTRKCIALDLKYRPIRWAGDDKNTAAGRLIMENSARHEQRRFHVCHSPILDMATPYSYLLAKLKDLLHEEGRRLFLKTSVISAYLGTIQRGEAPYLEFGEYPAVEAIGFAAFSLADYRSPEPEEDRGRAYRSPQSWMGF